MVYVMPSLFMIYFTILASLISFRYHIYSCVFTSRYWKHAMFNTPVPSMYHTFKHISSSKTKGNSCLQDFRFLIFLLKNLVNDQLVCLAHFNNCSAHTSGMILAQTTKLCHHLMSHVMTSRIKTMLKFTFKN